MESSLLGHEIIQFGMIATSLGAVWRLWAMGRARVVKEVTLEKDVESAMAQISELKKKREKDNERVFGKFDGLLETTNSMATDIALIKREICKD